MQTPANALTTAIIAHIVKSGGFAWRQNTGGIFDRTKGVYRTSAKKGVADILACVKGHLVAVEVKIGADRLSDEQQGFLANVGHTWGAAYVAKDLPSFIAWWDGVCSDLSTVVDWRRKVSH